MKKSHFFLALLCLIFSAYLLSSLISEPEFPIKEKDAIVYSKQLFPLAPDSIIDWDTKLTMNYEDSSGELAMEAKYAAMTAVRDYYADMTEEEAALLRTGNTEWMEVGPSNVGGRTRAILIDKNDPTGETVWAGGVSGGLWKSINGGENWSPIDDFFENMAVTCIVQHPLYPDTMYFGTGEGMASNAPITGVPPLGVRGLGVWFSTDGGDNWDRLLNSVEPVGNPSFNICFQYLQKLVVKDNGDLFAATKDNFVMRLPKGSATDSLKWDKVQIFNDGLFNLAFITDLEIAPDGTFYAGAAVNNSSFVAASLFSSPDGMTWTRFSNIPLTGPGGANGSSHRIEIDCVPGLNPTDPSIVFVATTSGPKGWKTLIPPSCGAGGGSKVHGIFRSTDAGVTWDSLSLPLDVDPCVRHDFTNGQAIYDLALAVNPNDPDMIFVGGINLFRSTDGGISWDQMSHGAGNYGLQNVHVDQHVIAIDENNPGLIYFGNDGGIYRSDNGEVAAPDVPDLTVKNENFRVTQLYSVAPHPHTFSALAGTQDNVERSPSGSLPPVCGIV